MRALFAHWQVWALLSAVFAALTAILGKIGVERVDPTFATLIRTCVILPVIAVLALATGSVQPLGDIPQRSYLFLAASGLATGLSWVCYYHALQMGPAAQVAPLEKFSVVIVALLGVFVLGEYLSLRHWIGVGFIAAGALLIARP